MPTDRDRVNDLTIAVRLIEQAVSMLRDEVEDLRQTLDTRCARCASQIDALREAAAIRLALEVAEKEATSSQVIRRGQHLSLSGQLGAAIIGAGGAVLVWVLTRIWEAWKH